MDNSIVENCGIGQDTLSFDLAFPSLILADDISEDITVPVLVGIVCNVLKYSFMFPDRKTQVPTKFVKVRYHSNRVSVVS